MHINNAPKISVIMGVYYRSSNVETLRRSVLSILQQTVMEFEFLICDDGSSSEAMTELDRLAEMDSRIRLIREGELFTLPQKLNRCLEHSTGAFIARMDDDDWSYPERFERQLKVLNEHSDIAFVGSNVELWRDGEQTGERILPEYPGKEDFLFVQPFIHPSLMFRAEVFKNIRYSEDKRCLLCEDYDLLLRLYGNHFYGMNIQDKLLRYTIADSGTRKRKFRHRVNECVTRFKRFRSLKMLPKAMPYVVKPIVVGLIPETLLDKIKRKRYNKH